MLLDIEMTGMDGVELARTVRRENDDVQIIFVTGYADYIAEGYEVSALHYLTRPVNEEKLFQVLHNYVTVHVGRDCAVKRPLGELEKAASSTSPLPTSPMRASR